MWNNLRIFKGRNTQKVILKSATEILFTENDITTLYDISHFLKAIRYNVGRLSIYYDEHFDEIKVYIYPYQRGIRYHTLNYEPSEYPHFVFIDDGQDRTVETPTKTIYLPPAETPLEWIERVTARIFHVTQRIAVLRHEEPHQNALSEKICREVPEDHDEVLRYDISCNLIKRPIGWLALQLENYESKYNRHLAAVEAAQKANRAIPNFNDNTDRNKIEEMLDKVDESLTEECLRDHFDLHRTADWDPIQNTQRKITLCNDDANRTPGEVLVDVNAFFTDGRGRIAQEHAKKTYHDISTRYWVKAKRTSHRTLVTERTVTLD